MTAAGLLAASIVGGGCAGRTAIVLIPDAEACFFVQAGTSVGEKKVLYDSYIVEETMFRQLVEKATDQPIGGDGK